MGMFSKQGWKDWASEWGLTYHAPKFLGSTREWMVGSYRGYLNQAGLFGDRNVEFYALIRFPKVLDPVMIRQRMVDDTTLTDVPGWSKAQARRQSEDPGPARAPECRRGQADAHERRRRQAVHRRRLEPGVDPAPARGGGRAPTSSRPGSRSWWSALSQTTRPFEGAASMAGAPWVSAT